MGGSLSSRAILDVPSVPIRYQRLRKRTSSELPTEKVIERRTLQPLLYNHSPTNEIEFVTVLFCYGGQVEGEGEEGETSYNPLRVVKYVGVPSDFDSDEDEPRAAPDESVGASHQTHRPVEVNAVTGHMTPHQSALVVGDGNKMAAAAPVTLGVKQEQDQLFPLSQPTLGLVATTLGSGVDRVKHDPTDVGKQTVADMHMGEGTVVPSSSSSNCSSSVQQSSDPMKSSNERSNTLTKHSSPMLHPSKLLLSQTQSHVTSASSKSHLPRARSRSPVGHRQRHPSTSGNSQSGSPIPRIKRERSRSPIPRIKRERSRSPLPQTNRERSRSPILRILSHSSTESGSRSRSPMFRTRTHRSRRSRSPISRSRRRSLSPVHRTSGQSSSSSHHPRKRSRSPIPRLSSQSQSPIPHSNGQLPHMTGRSRSPIVHRRRSKSPIPRLRRQSKSPIPRSRRQSKSPIPRSRRQSKSPILRPRRQSKSPTPILRPSRRSRSPIPRVSSHAESGRSLSPIPRPSYARMSSQTQDYHHRTNSGDDFGLKGEEEEGVQVKEEPEDFYEAEDNSLEKAKGLFFHCDVCDVNVNSIEVLQAHFAGARHQKKLKSLGMNEDLVKFHGKVDPFKEEKIFRCKLCDVIISGSERDIHLSGQKHTSVLEEKGETSTSKDCFQEVAKHSDRAIGRSEMDFHCEMCGVTIPNEEAFRLHIIGKRHQKKVKMIKEQIEAGKSGTVATTNVPSYGQFHCKICNIYCTNQESLDGHFSGKKHKKMLKAKGLIVDRHTVDAAKQRRKQQQQWWDKQRREGPQKWESKTMRCTICWTKLHSKEDVHLHLASQEHLDAVLSQEDSLEVTDVIVPESTVHPSKYWW